MDAIIGRYKVRMDSNQLVLTHSEGISFSLTLEEAKGLFNFMNVYRESFISMQANTEQRKESIRLEKPHNDSEPLDLA